MHIFYLSKYLPIQISYFLQLAYTAPNRPNNYKGCHASFSTHFFWKQSPTLHVSLNKHTKKINQPILPCAGAGLLFPHLYLFSPTHSSNSTLFSFQFISPLGLLLCHQDKCNFRSRALRNSFADVNSQLILSHQPGGCIITRSKLGKNNTDGFRRCPWIWMVRHFIPNHPTCIYQWVNVRAMYHTEYLHTLKQLAGGLTPVYLDFHIFVTHIQFAACHEMSSVVDSSGRKSVLSKLRTTVSKMSAALIK